jgi:hypothetical protein
LKIFREGHVRYLQSSIFEIMERSVNSESFRPPGSMPESRLRSPETEEAERAGARKALFEALAEKKMFAAFAAVVSLAPYASETLKGTRAGKLIRDDVTLRDVASWEDRPKLEGLPSYEAMRRELAESFGEETLENEIPVHTEDYVESIRKMREKQERTKEPLQVNGFEEKYGIPDEAMRRIIGETVPSGWSGAGTVSRLSIASERIPMSDESGLHGHADGVCLDGKWTDASTILVAPDYKPSQETPELLIHELAHANDWNRSNVLSPEDRLTLLHLVHGRVSSPDHLRFPYVESINNPDKKAEHLRKCTEYWAVLMEKALTIPAESKKEWELAFRTMAVETWAHPQAHPSKDAFGQKDLRIVNWYLNAVDPSFRPWEAVKKRRDLIEKTMLEAYGREVQERLRPIPSAPLRVLFRQSMHADQDHPAMRLSAVFAGYKDEGVPKEILDYVERYEEARESEYRAWWRRPGNQTAREALSALWHFLRKVPSYSQSLSSVRRSWVLRIVDRRIQDVMEALRACAPEDVSALERDMKEYDRIMRGRAVFSERPPKSFGQYVANLTRKKLL